MMRATIVTDFETNMATMLGHVTHDHVPLFVTRNGGRNVVVVSAQDCAGMHEKMHLMSNRVTARELRDPVVELNAGTGDVRALIEE